MYFWIYFISYHIVQLEIITVFRKPTWTPELLMS